MSRGKCQQRTHFPTTLCWSVTFLPRFRLYIAWVRSLIGPSNVSLSTGVWGDFYIFTGPRCQSFRLYSLDPLCLWRFETPCFQEFLREPECLMIYPFCCLEIWAWRIFLKLSLTKTCRTKTKCLSLRWRVSQCLTDSKDACLADWWVRKTKPFWSFYCRDRKMLKILF